MRISNKRKWRLIRGYSIGWTLAFLFLGIVRGEGTQELGSVQFNFRDTVLACLLMGPIFGSISGFAQILTETYGYKKISIQKLLFLRLVYAILFVASIILLAYTIYGKDLSLWEFAFEPGSFAIYFYIITVDIFLSSFRQVSLFLGSDNFWKLMRGQYYTPREEERIFMFLDLKSSTTHAERLGHLAYSKMIQDCFNDLGVVIENEAEIYQYVGDEVILTWPLPQGLRNQNCIRAYFNFMQQLDKRRDYYSDHYQSQPHFKAGMHAGVVTVTEVGKFKKEIAYHGDTINTAARIQGQCNAFQQDFLISESLKHQLAHPDFRFTELGSVTLKGKEQQVGIYAVNLTNGL